MLRCPAACAALLACLLAATAYSQQATPPATQPTPRVLVLLGPGYNVGEFHGTYFALRAAGYAVDVAGPAKGPIEAGSKNRALDWPADLALDDVKPEAYFALAIPGGGSPANLEKLPKSIAIVQAFATAKKPIAAICHGPRLLMRAGVLKDRVATSLWKVKDELGDDWIGNYGCYIDQQVVTDNELTTARYPNDVTPWATTFLKTFEKHGGLKIPAKPANALVVAWGLTGPDKWVFSAGMEPANVKATIVTSAADLEKLGNPQDFGVLAMLSTQTKPTEAEAAQINKLATRYITGQGPDRSLLTLGQASLATAGNLLPQIVAAAHRSAEGRTAATLPSTRRFNAIIRIEPGFDPRAYVAVEAQLKSMGYEALNVGRDKTGWIKSKDGFPVFVPMTYEDAQRGNLLSDSAIEIVPQKLAAGTKPNHLYAAIDEVLLNASDPTSGQPDLRVLHRVMCAAVGEYKGNPRDPYDAAVVLSPGFDERAAVAVQSRLQAIGSGSHVAFIAAEKGKIRGLNGITLEADYTFANPPKFHTKPILVAPGGFWPDALEKSRQQRVAFLAKQYADGATLYAFGTDAFLLAKEGGLKDTATWKWATTDQAVWSFEKGMGGYSPDKARLTAERLYTIKSGEYVADLWKLLDAK